MLMTGGVKVAKVDEEGTKSDAKCFDLMVLGPNFMMGLTCLFNEYGECQLITVDATSSMGGSDSCPDIFIEIYSDGTPDIPCPPSFVRRDLQQVPSKPTIKKAAPRKL